MMATDPEVVDDAVVDPVEEDSASLDAEMDGQSPAQYATSDQIAVLQNLYQESLKNTQLLERSVNGLASKVDTGLNAIRRDTMAASLAAQQRDREAFIASLNLDDQQASQLRAQFQVQDNAQEAAIQGMVQQQPVPQQSEPAQQVAPDEAVRRMVADEGVNPSDPRVNYAALTDTSLTDVQKLGRFYQSIEAAKVPPAAPVQPAPQQAQRARVEREGNPPVEPAQAQTTSFNTEDDVLNAFIEGKITKEVRDERLKAVGSDLTFRAQ
jgi:hypothetical protein